jgi:HSP20 family protein
MAINRGSGSRPAVVRGVISHWADDPFFQGGFAGPNANGLEVPIDLYDAGDAFVLRAVVPGASADSIDVTVVGDVLRISGRVEMHQADSAQNVSWLVHEIPHGAFSRTVTLPRRVDSDQASAEFDGGILTLRLPKAAQHLPRQIKITSR